MQRERPATMPGVFPRSQATRFMRAIEVTHGTNMTHKYAAGQVVLYDSRFGNNAARGQYTIVRGLPVESDNRLSYRIKSAAESFERTAEEHQLSPTD
jgi:hypothetical protein